MWSASTARPVVSQWSTTVTDAHRPKDDQLEGLLMAFWNDMQQFCISPTFDHRGSYSERKRDELNAIKGKYQAAIEHCLLNRTLGV